MNYLYLTSVRVKDIRFVLVSPPIKIEANFVALAENSILWAIHPIELIRVPHPS